MNKDTAPSRHSLYFSHSWKPSDVDINVTIWDAIGERCELLVDRNPDPTTKPPWYVNRLEEYIRRSDLFLAALPFRNSRVEDPRYPDEKVRCSPWSLFEVRLAERARKPRLVIYDSRTHFQPGTETSKQVRYLPYNLEDLRGNRGRYIRDELVDWLDEVDKVIPARTFRPNQKATLLVPEAADRDRIVEAATKGLEAADFIEVAIITATHTDVEVLNHLYASGLLVAELGSGPLWDAYGMAHALFLPTVRLMRSGDGYGTEVPIILRGHPGGYQQDLVRWTTYEELQTEVARHAAAMRDTRHPIASFEEGRQHFQRVLSEGELHHRVFISHNLEDRALVEAVVGRLRRAGVNAWEYGTENRAGQNWRDKLAQELAEATHVVAILADGYELSDACNMELDVLLGRGDIVWLPFLYGGRKRHNPRLGRFSLHHESLSGDPEEAAGQVLRAVETGLTKAEHNPD
jgi:TIR domain-containing protein